MIRVLRVTFRLHSSYIPYTARRARYISAHGCVQSGILSRYNTGELARSELLRLRRALVSTSSHRSFFYPSRELSSPLSRGQFYIPPTEVLSEQKLFKRILDLSCNIEKGGTRYSDLIAPRGTIFHVTPGATYSLS